MHGEKMAQIDEVITR